ncbi:Phenylacetate 2-hydroxylase [Sphaceloma murrayae]|uniref:Phenylacetate 2-hydroxylase n=1 Tax=Sphaceloma murrayae TaxID=2082308 RepID=A0A2K1R2N3_9PEZI|nr:Phenylacetate 2-hydroxylase [Sphaceloma murrayae]
MGLAAYTPLIGVFAIVSWIALSVIRSKVKARKYNMPNRVKGIPIFGNTFQIPVDTCGQAVWATELAKKHGEMFTVQLGTKDWVFLNSSRVVNEIMEKRAAMYSSRMEQPMVQDIISGGRRIVMMPYNERWRALRKIMHSILNSTHLNLYAEYQDLETKQLLWDYLQEPETWFRTNQAFTNSVIMSVVFGRRLRPNDPNLLPLFRQAEEFVKNIQPGMNIVDGYPALAKLPVALQWWRPRGEALYRESVRVYKYEVDLIKEKMQKGNPPSCFAVDFLNSTAKSDMDEEQKYFALGSLMEAGSDTSRMTMSQVIAAATLQPDWVQRCQAELDKVCGDAARLPTFDDKNQLKIITGVVKEGLRWRPFAPIGFPTMSTQDDEFEGYKWPAGTIFTWNNHYITQNEEEYEQATRFWPERWFNDDLDKVLKGHWSFGPGRRVCVGYNVAQTNLWIALARLLYCFDFHPVPGQPIEIDKIEWGHYEDAHFAVNIKPRSEKHKQLIIRDCGNVSDVVY